MSISNAPASLPDLLQVTSPIGVPVSVGVADVKASFSATLWLANPVIDSVAVSTTSVTVTAIETDCVLLSASVTVTVTV